MAAKAVPSGLGLRMATAVKLKSTAGFLLIFLSEFGFGQDTIYYNREWRKTDSYLEMEYYSIITRDDADTSKAWENSYYRSGQIRKAAFYSNYSKGIKEGQSKTWYESGKLKEEAHFSNNKLDGKLLTYWENGQLKREDSYVSGKLEEGRVYQLDGSPEPYYDYEIMPKYPGGLNAMTRYIKANVKYPKKARRAGISGKVLLRFVVDGDGSVKNVSVEKGVSEELDAEAVRVIKNMPRWEPARLDGKKVSVYYMLPINFRID